MKIYIYIAALSLYGSGFAQEQNRDPNQAPTRPAQTRPGINQPAPSTTETTPRTATERTKEGLSNILTDWRLEDLPAAVQKTVREQSGGQQIADIDRETRTGRTIWEVEFEKAGRNTEIHIAEDGALLPEGDGLFGRSTAETGTAPRPGERPAATGTPAGTQTGRSGVALAMGTKWEDLPKPVQQKAMQFGGKDKVADIDREDWRGKVAYEIEFRREGRNLEIHFADDGTILESNDPNAAPAQGSAPGTDSAQSPSVQPAQPTQPRPTPPAQSTPQSQPKSNPGQPLP